MSTFPLCSFYNIDLQILFLHIQVAQCRPGSYVVHMNAIPLYLSVKSLFIDPTKTAFQNPKRQTVRETDNIVAPNIAHTMTYHSQCVPALYVTADMDRTKIACTNWDQNQLTYLSQRIACTPSKSAVPKLCTRGTRNPNISPTLCPTRNTKHYPHIYTHTKKYNLQTSVTQTQSVTWSLNPQNLQNPTP